MISDIDIPKSFVMDSDSRLASMGASWGNAFCGVIAVEPERDLGTIYLAPYTQSATRPNWDPKTVGGYTEFSSGLAHCGGQPLASNFAGGKIYHQENGIAGHEQLVNFLKTQGGIQVEYWIGFSLIYCPAKDGFGSTSRSQNNQHFRQFLFNDQDKAFKQYHTEQNAPANTQGAPNFHDVTGTGPNDGSLPADWIDAVKKALATCLGRDYQSCVEAKIGNVHNPPPPPPKK